MWPQLARSCCWAAGLFGWLCPKSATLAQTRPKLIVLHTISTSERELFDVATPTPTHPSVRYCGLMCKKSRSVDVWSSRAPARSLASPHASATRARPLAPAIPRASLSHLAAPPARLSNLSKCKSPRASRRTNGQCASPHRATRCRTSQMDHARPATRNAMQAKQARARDVVIERLARRRPPKAATKVRC
jgi:hypothetical protein